MAQTKRRTPLSTTGETIQNVALYARVSTEDQAERETIGAQLDFLRRFMDLHELPVAGEYVDDGISGAVPLGDRPEGRRLLTDAEAGVFGSVLVYRLSRLGRTLRTIVDAHDALSRYDVAIRSGTEPFDTSTPTGTLIFQMLASFAEYDRSVISENTSRGRNRVAAKGQYTGGPIPLGYDVDDDKRFVFSTRVVPGLDISEGDLVREIFDRVADGQSTALAEAARLTALGVPNQKRYGGKGGAVKERPSGWRGTAIQAILHNPMYKGQGLLDSQYGQVVRPVPALVDPATWERAQEALLRNRRLSAKNAKHDYLLRGLIRCANCGAAYTGSTRSQRRGGQAQTLRRYGCGGQANHHAGRAEPRCPAKLLNADWLEAVVWDECRRFVHNPGPALDEARRKLRERMAESTRFDAERRRTLDALAEKETERERVLTLYRRGTIDAEEAEQQLDAVAREAGMLRADLESLRAQSALLDIQEAHLAQSTAMLEKLRDELDDIDASNDVSRKRDVIEAYVRKVTVTTQRVGPRKLEADVRLFLRLKPESIPVETTTPARSH